MLSGKRVSRGNPEKLYIQLYNILKWKVESGEWATGMLIPSEKELCHIYGVSRATVKAAVSLLANQGFFVRKQGSGTFVNDWRGYQDKKTDIERRKIEEILHKVNNTLAVIGEKAGWLQDLLEDEKDAIKNYKEYEDVIRKIKLQVKRVCEVTRSMTDLHRKIESLKSDRNKKNNGGKKSA